MHRLLTIALCLALGGAFATGCGGDEDQSAGAGATKEQAAPSEQATSEEPATDSGNNETVEISIENIEFIPMEATAQVGQEVVWTNNDPFAHTVTAESGADFDSGDVEGGQTYEFTPEQTGTIEYVCTIHADHRGTLTVTE